MRTAKCCRSALAHEVIRVIRLQSDQAIFHIKTIQKDLGFLKSISGCPQLRSSSSAASTCFRLSASRRKRHGPRKPGTGQALHFSGGGPRSLQGRSQRASKEKNEEQTRKNKKQNKKKTWFSLKKSPVKLSGPKFWAQGRPRCPGPEVAPAQTGPGRKLASRLPATLGSPDSLC